MRLAHAFRDRIARPEVSDPDFVLRCSCGTRPPDADADEVLIPARPNVFIQYRYL
jgi:hypothetical protein